VRHGSLPESAGLVNNGSRDRPCHHNQPPLRIENPPATLRALREAARSPAEVRSLVQSR